ncbi:MAG: hypothetical protein A4S09_10755 [Proteobacteria bacterium SG_bin7]|nr:MAG: hypothetical protein A4S09_10755 [Proteobacteria bacterium SG_bin7]
MLANSLVLKCTLWATMWVNNGSMKIIEDIKIESEESTITRQLKSQELTVQRYADFVSISLTRPPTKDEKETFASFKHDYPLENIVVARTSGTLTQNNKSDSVEVGSKEYFVSCKY